MQINNTIPLLLKNPKILIIGGGNVALQKASVLKENNIEFHIISDEISKKIAKTTPYIKQKRFKLKDIKDFFIIIDATGVSQIADKLLKYKKKNSVLLNIVNNPAKSDFYFMALTKNIPLQIAVSSNGASPTAAKFFRDECEKIIPNNISKYLVKKQKQREEGIIKKKKTHRELSKGKEANL